MSLNHSWMQRDLSVLWHPCTQMKDHEQLPLMPDQARRGRLARGFRRQTLPRRRQLLVGQRIRPRQPAHQSAHQGSARSARTRDARRLQPPTGGRAVGTAGQRLRHAGLDRVFYTDNGSTGIEVALKMSYHYWRNSRSTEQATLRHPHQQLPRRNRRSHVGWRRSAVYRHL
jgi:adenosylmethionine---8-amino-7-oxononanoate aminotransferase